MTTWTILTGSQTTAGSIKNLTNVGDCDPGTILEEAQNYIYRKLRVRQMLAETTGVFTVSTTTGVGDAVDVPDDYLAVESIQITGVNAAPLERKTISHVRGLWSYDASGARTLSKPRYFYADGASLRFDCCAIQAYPWNMLYYQQPAALGASNDYNFLSTRGVRALVSACRGFVGEFRKDETERDYWLKIALAAVDDLNTESDLEEGTANAAAVVV